MLATKLGDRVLVKCSVRCPYQMSCRGWVGTNLLAAPLALHYTHLYTTSMLECVKMKVIFLQEGGQLLKLHYISALGNALNVSLNTIREEKFWAHNIFKTNGFIHKLASFLQPPSWFP